MVRAHFKHGLPPSDRSPSPVLASPREDTEGEGVRRSRPGIVPYLLDAAYLGSLLFTLPYLVCVGRGGRVIEHIRRRSGNIPSRKGQRPCIWVHGVSVGEILSARGLLSRIADAFPNWDIALSTTTRAGVEAGRKHYPDRRVFSYPFDLSFLVKRTFDRIRPDLVIIVEHELWPNFLRHAESRGVPVVIVNGRLSERSLRGYRWLSKILRWPPRGIVRFCVEDERSAAGFQELGVAPENVIVTGNFKFDNATDAPTCLRDDLGLAPEDWTLVAGSTHGGEEEMLVDSFCRLRAEDSRARLVLAPRRVERSGEISRIVERRGFRSVLWSTLNGGSATVGGNGNSNVGGNGNGNSNVGGNGNGNGNGNGLNGRRALGSDEVLLVDTVGDLQRISSAGDVVFVGGSMIPFGGHNVIEPASHARPVVIGPHHASFRQIVASFVENDALMVVRDRHELLSKLRYLKSHPDEARDMGKRAAETVRKNEGAAERTFQALRPLMQELERKRS